jgi:hypothetical protein
VDPGFRTIRWDRPKHAGHEECLRRKPAPAATIPALPR